MTRRSGHIERGLSKRERVITSLSHRGLLISAVISVAFAFGLAGFDSQALWFAWLRLTLGCLVGVEGYALSTNWQDARDLTLVRLGSTGRQQKLASRTRLRSLMISLGLQLLGVLWVGTGLFLIARAVEVLL